MPGLRYKIDSNHDIVYLDFEEPTMTVQEVIRGVDFSGTTPQIITDSGAHDLSTVRAVLDG